LAVGKTWSFSFYSCTSTNAFMAWSLSTGKTLPFSTICHHPLLILIYSVLLQISEKQVVLTNIRKVLTVFWDIMLCSPLQVSQCFRGTYCLCPQGQRMSWARYQCEKRWQAESSCWAYSSTLKMEAICSSKTSGDFQWTTWLYMLIL
jgi:hypothetical protein